MANMFIVTSFLLVIFTHSLSDGAHIGYSNNIEIEDITKFTNDVSESAFNDLKSAYESVSRKIQNILSTRGDNIEILASHYKSKLNKIENDFENLEVDLSECIVRHEKQLDKLVNEAFTDLYECANDIVIELNSTYDKTLAAIQEAIDDIFETIGTLSDCTTKECFADVGKQITSEFDEMKVHIAKALADGLDEIWKLLPNAALCGLDVLDPYKDEIEEILKDIFKCIKEKYPEGGTTNNYIN